jgi:TRAP-type transport system periplasmic protein
MEKVGRSHNVLLTVLLSVLFMLLCSHLTAARAAEQTFALRLSNPLQEESLVSRAFENWGKDLEKQTNGRIKVRYYPNGTLASMPQQYDAAVGGIAEVSMHILGNTIGRFPLTQGLDLPLGWPNAIIATRVANEYYEKFKPKDLDAVKLLWIHEQGPGWFATIKKPVYKLEDLKGMKVRTAGNTANFMKALGAAPVAMPMTETYDALSRGMADGLSSCYEALENYKTGELIKYVTENRESGYSATCLIVMNKKFWDSLPKDIQAIVDRLSREQWAKFGDAWEAAHLSGKNFCLKNGAKITTLSKEEEARWIEKGANPIIAAYVADTKQKNLPGEDVVKFVRERIKALKNP